MDSNIILIRNFSIPLSDLDKSNRKINKKENMELNKLLEKLELKNLLHLLNRTAKDHTYFSVPHRSFQKLTKY